MSSFFITIPISILFTSSRTTFLDILLSSHSVVHHPAGNFCPPAATEECFPTKHGNIFFLFLLLHLQVLFDQILLSGKAQLLNRLKC
ncbi:hypothetical protein X975_16368, partial [Stegodyphus mimosarum]